MFVMGMIITPYILLTMKAKSNHIATGCRSSSLAITWRQKFTGSTCHKPSLAEFRVYAFQSVDAWFRCTHLLTSPMIGQLAAYRRRGSCNVTSPVSRCQQASTTGPIPMCASPNVLGDIEDGCRRKSPTPLDFFVLVNFDPRHPRPTCALMIQRNTTRCRPRRREVRR